MLDSLKNSLKRAESVDILTAFFYFSGFNALAEELKDKERIAALRTLHDAGCKTWVSIEPYPTPNFIEQDLNEILDAISFCDKIIFGRLNYNKKVSEYKDHKVYFNKLAEQVIAYCEANGKQYHIKDGTIT